MKFQIDTTQKTIKIEEKVNLGDLFDKLNQLFQEEEWKEYSIEVTVITNWTNPWIIKEVPEVNPYPWWQSSIIYNTPGTSNPSDVRMTLTSGQYNVIL